MTISRRRILRMISTGLIAANSGIPSVMAESKDTLRIALAAAGPRRCDPNTATQGADFWATEQLYEQLVRPPNGQFGTKQSDFKPCLAERFSSSGDLRTWEFKLREGVEFHKDYGEMTSDDVVFSFERAMHGGSRQTLFQNIETVEADGRYGFIMKLRKPDPMALGGLVFTDNTSIVSKKAAETLGDAFDRDAIGTGAFELERFDTTTGVYLRAFDKYWGTKAHIRNVELLYIADAAARTLALASGKVDIIDGVRAPGWVQSMQNRDQTLRFDMTVPGSFLTLHFNLKRKPFDDLRIRQAIAYAVNQEVIAKAFVPIGKAMFGLQPPGFPAGLSVTDFPEELRFAHNPERAKNLMRDAGYADGLEFDCLCSQREDYSSTMLMIQDQLRGVGIQMNLRLVEHSTFHAENQKDKNSLILLAASYPPIPTQLYLDYLVSDAEVKSDGSGGENMSHYGVAIPGVDGLIERISSTTAYEDYVEACRQVELQVRRDLPVIGVGTLSYTMARRANVDLGFKVQSGFARWRLDLAKVS